MNAKREDTVDANASSATDLGRRRFIAGLGASAAIVSSGTRMRPASAQAPLNIGVLLPVSGVQAALGQSSKRGADIAAPVLSALGYKVSIRLMHADIESNVDVARSRAERLINDGAHVLIGAFDSGATAAIAQVCEQRGVPLVVNIAAAPQITEQGYKFVFRNFPTAVDLVRNGLSLIGDLFQATNTVPRTAVYMHVNDTFGQAMTRGISALLPRLTHLPFRIVQTIPYDVTARDLSVEVAKAKATNADFLLLVCRLNDAILLRREMVKQRWTPMGIIGPGNPGLYEAQFFKTLGKLSEYCITNIAWHNPKSSLTKLVDAAYRKTFPGENLLFHAFNVGFTFEAIMVAADAYQRAGATNGKALADAIRKTDIANRMMIGGPIRFNAKGQVEGIASACVQNLKLRPTVVLPAQYAEAKPVFPMPGYRRA